MLDIKLIRTNPDQARAGLAKRGVEELVDDLLRLDQERRDRLTTVENLKNKRNVVSKEVGCLKAAKADATELINEMKQVNEEIRKLDGEIKDVEDIISKLMAFQVAIPSWALGTGGTRFGRFPGGGEPRNLEEKIEDIGLLHQLNQSSGAEARNCS